VAAAAALFVAPSARAEEDPPPRPFAVPFLVHDTGEVRLVSTFADVGPVDSSRRGAALGMQRLSIEAPVVGTRVYASATYVGVLGVPPGVDSGRKLLGGNTDASIRSVWAFNGLAFGGGVGVVLPSADHASPGARDVALAAATVDPRDINGYRTLSIGLKPAVDVRVATGAVSFQIRQGLEYASEPGALEKARLATLTTLSAAVRFGDISVAGEVIELYLIDSQVADGRRTSVVVQGGASWELGHVVPEVQLFSTVGTTLSPSVDHAFGMRLGMTWRWFEPRLRVEEPGH
jgi:hypothetical protein